jgi:hypothetical protein
MFAISQNNRGRNMSIFSRLFGQKPKKIDYSDNADLWRDWRKLGITENTPLEIDFSFISPQRESAETFTQYLQKSGYQAGFEEYKIYEKSHPGEKMWDIHLLYPQQTWNLEKLNQKAKELKELAEKYSCAIDGIGAMMPHK